MGRKTGDQASVIGGFTAPGFAVQGLILIRVIRVIRGSPYFICVY